MFTNNKMDIVIEQIPVETPQSPEAQPQLQRETTEYVPQEVPIPQRRGRPTGSKNKPMIIEQVPEEPYETLIPIPTQVIEHPPRPEPTILNEPAPKKPAAPRKPRAPKAQAPAPPPTPQAPIPQTPLQVAASMLDILRLEQAERQYRKGADV